MSPNNKFTWFGDVHGPKRNKFLGFLWVFTSQTPVTQLSPGDPPPPQQIITAAPLRARNSRVSSPAQSTGSCGVTPGGRIKTSHIAPIPEVPAEGHLRPDLVHKASRGGGSKPQKRTPSSHRRVQQLKLPSACGRTRIAFFSRPRDILRMIHFRRIRMCLSPLLAVEACPDGVDEV